MQMVGHLVIIQNQTYGTYGVMLKFLFDLKNVSPY